MVLMVIMVMYRLSMKLLCSRSMKPNVPKARTEQSMNRTVRALGICLRIFWKGVNYQGITIHFFLLKGIFKKMIFS